MEIISFIRERGLDALTSLGIKAVRHENEPLVIFNYDQIESPKTNSIVREARGLVLEMHTWDVVARAFPRFFNYGEAPEITSKFDWGNFTVQEKCDGSLVLLYFYGERWRVNTRGSFATYPIVENGPSWEKVIWSCINQFNTESLARDRTYVFEFCSPYNQVVKYHDKPTLYLLSEFSKEGYEQSDEYCDYIAKRLGVLRPRRYEFSSIEDVQTFLAQVPDPTFEGFVLRDHTGLRLKVKNLRYVALHHLRGNGNNLCSTKNLIPLILSEAEVDPEWLTYFEYARAPYEQTKLALDLLLKQMMEVWENAKHFATQKEFAAYILDKTPLHAILFKARKTGMDPSVIFKESADLLIKVVSHECVRTY